ncbi:hypothetical protein ARMSODRAFT_129930 [Armillaria solidipes]|uniref:Yeast cell wall synthesis Kre9/Knh1-like N-terminal domain-containing protein n=1 Tax=Armillaria solidipes TaxID=1076256 RepID=A0A2H3BVW8_9AGAR|nr:hypothetical protein ARMSODRAFT_129930 [Armillaria solidipes]
MKLPLPRGPSNKTLVIPTFLFPSFPQPFPFTMFSTYLALAALPLTLVHGLTISNPTETVTSTGPITISWQTSSGDPSVFSIELINQSFNSQYAIANNVDSSLGSLSVTLP